MPEMLLRESNEGNAGDPSWSRGPAWRTSRRLGVPWPASDGCRLLATKSAVQLDGLVEMSREDLGDRPVLGPRLLGVGVEEESVVELEQILQSAPERGLAHRILESESLELLVNSRVEVVEQHLRPELVKLLHLLGSLDRLRVLALLESRLANLGIGLAVALFSGGSSPMPVNPDDPVIGMVRLLDSLGIGSLSVDAIGGLALQERKSELPDDWE